MGKLCGVCFYFYVSKVVGKWYLHLVMSVNCLIRLVGYSTDMIKFIVLVCKLHLIVGGTQF